MIPGARAFPLFLSTLYTINRDCGCMSIRKYDIGMLFTGKSTRPKEVQKVGDISSTRFGEDCFATNGQVPLDKGEDRLPVLFLVNHI